MLFLKLNIKLTEVYTYLVYNGIHLSIMSIQKSNRDLKKEKPVTAPKAKILNLK